MDYVNPLTGGPVMQTIGAAMQLLRPGERTKAHRHTGSFIYQVAKGRVHRHRRQAVRLEGARHLLRAVLVVHEHANASTSEDACLFTSTTFR